MNLIRNWIRKLVQTDKPVSRQPRSALPCLESLEERQVPSTLTLPNTSVPSFTATYNMTEAGGQTVQVSGAPVAGGNFLGTLNGTTKLTASYCVNINQTIFTSTSYKNATVTTDGTTYGAAAPHAGAIAWLMTHVAPTATTTDQQDALQAAIWRTEYGNGFQLDGVDNSNFAPMINSDIAPIYKADLTALGKNTAAVSSVDWISPGANPDKSDAQALVAILTPTKTTLHSSLTSLTYGQAVTLTATVKPASGTGTPTGTVTFKDGTVTLGSATLVNGVAKLTTTHIPAGTDAITAVYNGSSTFATSTSAKVTETVKKAATKVTLSSSAATAAVGQQVTLTTKISVVAPGAGTPTGTVTFKDGTTVLGKTTLSNGVAIFKTTKLTKGKHTITAVYSGDADFTGATSATFTETIT
jgi:hypothetical protein